MVPSLANKQTDRLSALSRSWCLTWSLSSRAEIEQIEPCEHVKLQRIPVHRSTATATTTYQILSYLVTKPLGREACGFRVAIPCTSRVPSPPKPWCIPSQVIRIPDQSVVHWASCCVKPSRSLIGRAGSSFLRPAIICSLNPGYGFISWQHEPKASRSMIGAGAIQPFRTLFFPHLCSLIASFHPLLLCKLSGASVQCSKIPSFQPFSRIAIWYFFSLWVEACGTVRTSLWINRCWQKCRLSCPLLECVQTLTVRLRWRLFSLPL